MPVAQPLEERRGLLDLVGVAHAGARACTAAAMRSTTASIAREVADGELQLGERLAHGRDERLALLGASSGRSSSSRMTDSRPPASRASVTRAMRPSASRSMPTIGCSSRRTP